MSSRPIVQERGAPGAHTAANAITGAPSSGPAARSWALSTVDAVFVMILLVRGLTYWGPLLHTDSDAAAHIALGELILRTGRVPATDPFSWSMAGQPMLAHSWLGSVLFAVIDRVAGLPGIVVFVTAVLALVYALVALFLRRRGVDPRMVLLVAISACMLGTMHWLARPHIFSSLGAVTLLFLLERGSRREAMLVGRRYGQTYLQAYVPIALLFMLWANLHGGFLFGLIMIGAYLVGACAEWVASADRARWTARVREYGTALVVAAAAACANPYGVTIFPRLIGALGDGSTAALTVEYGSPDFHGGTEQIFLAAVLATVALLGITRRRMPLPQLALVLASIGFALYSIRNVDLFAVTGWPLVWLHASQELKRRRPGYIFGDDFARVERIARVGPFALASFLGMSALAANGGRVGRLHFLPERFDSGQFPVHAVAWARREGVRGRLFNDFRWGGYLIFAWPEQPVFIETLKYTGPVTETYMRIVGGAPGWESELDRTGADLVLVPREGALGHALRTSARGWRVAYADGTATLFRRGTRAAPAADGR